MFFYKHKRSTETGYAVQNISFAVHRGDLPILIEIRFPLPIASLRTQPQDIKLSAINWRINYRKCKKKIKFISYYDRKEVDELTERPAEEELPYSLSKVA